MPVSRKAHHAQLPATPLTLTMSVTKLGVSAEKVVATIEIPSNHQGIFLPDRKNSSLLCPDFLATANPMIRVMIKNRTMMIQSVWLSCMILMFG